MCVPTHQPECVHLHKCTCKYGGTCVYVDPHECPVCSNSWEALCVCMDPQECAEYV